MKVLVHIGFHKTGTTSIQKSLKNSRSLLKKHGFLYPIVSNHINHFPIGISFVDNPENHYLVKKYGFDCENAKQWIFENIRQLDLQVNEFQGHTCILSAEFFERIPPKNIDIFREFLEARFDSIKIISYIRPAENSYTSELYQGVSSGQTTLNRLKSIGNWKKNIKRSLSKYLRAFNRYQIDVVKFSPEFLYENDAVTDFQKRFLTIEDNTIVQLRCVRAHESLSGAAVATLLLLSDKINMGDKNSKLKVIKKSLQSMKSSETFPKLKLPPDWVNLIKKNHQDQYIWLEDQFFDGVRGVFSDPTFSNSKMATLQEVSKAEFKKWLLSYITPDSYDKIQENLVESKVITKEINEILKSICPN